MTECCSQNYINYIIEPLQIKCVALKDAIILNKLINSEIPTIDWLDLHFQQSFNMRDPTFKYFGTNNLRVGFNSIYNRLTVLNGKIVLNSVDGSLDSFKVLCKKYSLND